MDLNIDADDLNKCVQCGLCLPFCPTYRVTGEEIYSPRGRISLMREIQTSDASLTPEVLASFDTCVQCRGCEPACPSGVPYGHMMEATRERLSETGDGAPRWLRAGFAPLENPRLLRGGSSVLAFVNKSKLVPKRLGVPKGLSVRRKPHSTSGSDVFMFTGCVMDAWSRDVHFATQRNLEAAGFGVTPTADLAPCCGALQLHAGLTSTTRRLAEQLIEALTGDAPIVVNSAGCGATMKDYGRILGTEAASEFSARVYDSQEFLAMHLDKVHDVEPLDLVVAIQDPCHLRHVQMVHEATRTVLAPYVRSLVELDDEGLCCGAGGAYSVQQPLLAGQIRDRKVASIERAAPDVVASANPGCSMHLVGAGVRAYHPMQLVDAALTGERLDAQS
ncbi:MAG: (Fe-S)-binding protein [Actinobacteria bacterium]|nr:(Fe-S)-binding protein [Actinomycetota bacterium]